MISLVLYKHFPQQFFLQILVNDIHLNKVVKKSIKKGSIKDIAKLIMESRKYITWVFWYTAQNAEIKYQKKRNKRKVKIMKLVNFLWILDNISIIFWPFLFSFIVNAFISYTWVSVRLKKHKITSNKCETIKVNNNWGSFWTIFFMHWFMDKK